MQWKFYWRNVVQRYSVKIDGWLDPIKIENFSIAACPIDELRNLLRKWRSGAIYWRSVPQDELEDLHQARELLIADGMIQEPAPRRQRSDVGKKRKHRSVQVEDQGPAKRLCCRKSQASRDVLADDLENEEYEEGDEEGEWDGIGDNDDEDVDLPEDEDY